MMNLKNKTAQLKYFIILWATQALSSMGSAVTSFALIIWIYQQEGSALIMGLLSACSYAPYVLLSMFAGAVSDKWDKKKTVLICDSIAAIGTVAAFILLQNNQLEIWHLYVINGVNGLSGAFQSPASDVLITLLTPKKYYQKTSGMRSFSSSLITMLTPVLATTLLSLFSIKAVLIFDLVAFAIAFASLLFFIPVMEKQQEAQEQQLPVWQLIREGLAFLRTNLGILQLILFLAAINLVASMSDTALPALILSTYPNDERVLGLVNGITGLASLVGSIIVSLMPAPKKRVRIICIALFISFATENFILALTDSIPFWCVGAALGWLPIPFMSANMDVLLRARIPLEMQGRVYSVRNALQFFTIPIGHLTAGLLIDRLLSPPLAQGSFPLLTFSRTGNESGAGILLFFLGALGVVICIIFSRLKPMQQLDNSNGFE